VATAAAHGTATASGTSITYTPHTGYSGSDSFTYRATNATGTSAPATVTISVMTRPDPSKDANVVGIIGAQAEVAKRFSLTQISNFQSRLENLHVRLRPERPRGFDSPNARRPSVMPALAAVGNNSGPAAGNIDQNGGFGLATGTAVTNLGSRDAATGTGGVVTAGPAPGQESGFNPFAALSTLGQMANSHGLPTLNISSKASNFQDTGFDVWSAGNVSFGRLDDADAKFTTSGISFGTDSRFGDNLILGLGVGFGHERQKIGNDGTRNVGDDYSVIVYGSYQPVPGTFIDGLIGMGRLDLESRRYSAAAGAFATSQRTGKQWFASLSAAYEFQQDAHILSPYGRIDIASTRLDAAVESGAGIYNLAYFSQKAPVTKLSFGLRGETSVELETTLARPYFRVEYQHDFENPEGARMAYADDLSGPSYQIAATTLKRDTMVFGLGSDFVFKSAWTLGLRYQYSNNSGAMTMHTLGLQIRKSF
jgi:outer membrane autotransporter protein